MTIHNAVKLPPKKPLSFPHLEDNTSNAELVGSRLNSEKIACDLFRVESSADSMAALEKDGSALILAVHPQLQIAGRAAQEIASEIPPEPLFNVIYHAASENGVTEQLQAGATGYQLKPDLPRLAPVIRRAAHDVRTGFEIIGGDHV